MGFQFPLRATSLAILLAASAALPARALEVVASIKPVHALAAAVMQGTTEPTLIVTGVASPHAMALKPSQAQALSRADLVIWIGPSLEAFMDGPIDALSQKDKVLTLSQLPEVTRLEPREGGLFEAHGHDGHEAEGDHEDEHVHEDAHEGNHGDSEEGEDAHSHGDHAFDPHLWLDPDNAVLMAEAIAARLVELDAENADLYRNNLQTLRNELTELSAEIAAALEPVKSGRFIVFHDAYHYFENRFGLTARGAITINPETMPGAQRVAELRQRIQDNEIDCVFTEPQFEPKIVNVLLEGTNARSAELDPLGAALPEGPAHYAATLNQLAQTMRDCLSRP